MTLCGAVYFTIISFTMFDRYSTCQAPKNHFDTSTHAQVLVLVRFSITLNNFFKGLWIFFFLLFFFPFNLFLLLEVVGILRLVRPLLGIREPPLENIFFPFHAQNIFCGCVTPSNIFVANLKETTLNVIYYAFQNNFYDMYKPSQNNKTHFFGGQN